ncbi:MAG: hypothetical protein GF375_03735 [Candidatus Omnitrophica bacterium]|nr:hypothetical protein [Candidatus Omnitrophota bacterium]MBD3269172.1 hypothetical protein [Candidatus Omnitrophota bacterium]
MPINYILPEIAEDKEVIFVNQYEIFQNLDEPLRNYLSTDGGHLNGKGYGIMARNLFEKIIEKELISSD